MDMSDYERDERFDPMQLAAIRRGLHEGYDVTAYARPDLTWRQMDEVYMGLRDHVNVSVYADPKFSDGEMFEIRMGLWAGVDVTRYADPAFNEDQMHMVCLAMTNTGMDDGQLDALANPELDTTQMEQIVLAAAEDVDLTPWADPCYRPEQMREIRLGLKDGLDVTAYDDPETPAEQMAARREYLKARAEQRRGRQDGGLHPIDESMAEPLRRMEGKAMCALANWQGARPAANMDMNWAGEDAARAESEYEATVRCMAMLTREPLHEVCEHVIDKAREMVEASRQRHEKEGPRGPRR